MPTVNEIAECQLKFYENSRFPRVIGAIDCTHVKIQSPGNNIFKIKVILLICFFEFQVVRMQKSSETGKDIFP